MGAKVNFSFQSTYKCVSFQCHRMTNRTQVEEVDFDKYDSRRCGCVEKRGLTHQHCQTRHSSLEQRRVWPAGALQRTRNHPQLPASCSGVSFQPLKAIECWMKYLGSGIFSPFSATLPGELCISSQSRVCEGTWPPPAKEMRLSKN